MSAPGLMFNEVRTKNAHAPGAAGGTLKKVNKTWKFVVFLAWGPMAPADGFQNPRTVIGKS